MVQKSPFQAWNSFSNVTMCRSLGAGSSLHWERVGDATWKVSYLSISFVLFIYFFKEWHHFPVLFWARQSVRIPKSSFSLGRRLNMTILPFVYNTDLWSSLQVGWARVWGQPSSSVLCGCIPRWPWIDRGLLSCDSGAPLLWFRETTTLASRVFVAWLSFPPVGRRAKC